ncbi:MAG: GIY-YIG nuclease family protein [Patescibacteria group bacterium]
MFYVYVLQNQDNELYYGCTHDLKRRLIEHNEGKNRSTKNSLWKLVYYEAYRSKIDAVKREQRIKDYSQAWAQLKKRIANSRRHEC